MDNKSKKTSEIFDDLVERASYPFMLFVPKSYFVDLIDEEQITALSWLFDRIAFARKKLDVIFMDENELTFDLFQKNKNLRDNLFELVDHKTSLDEDRFLFIFEKYKDHIMVLEYFFELMVTEIENGDNKEYKKYLTFFELQLGYVNEHKKSIDETFPLYVERYKREIDFDAFLIDKVSEKKETQKPCKKRNRKPKKKLISDIESQNFLLKSVFKIDSDFLD